MLSRQQLVLLSAMMVLLLAWPLAAPAADAKIVPLKKGDRIVFLGDSITEGGARPNGYVTLIKKELTEKHKDLGIEIIGAGVSGNKVPDLQRRLDRDVLAKKPTVVVIYIGINDVWHGEKDPERGTSAEKFEAGLKEIIGKIKEAGARVILCTPSVIGEKVDGSNNLDAKLDAYSGISRRVAGEEKVELCDLRRAFVDYLKEHNAENKESGVLTTDRVHLNPVGNRFVAKVMLKALGE
jgi:isoamyl acetate esterase